MTVLQSYSLVLIKSILCIVSKASWRILYKEIGNRNITPFSFCVLLSVFVLKYNHFAMALKWLKKANGKPEKQNKTEGFYARHRNICVTITMIKRKENVKGLRGIHIILWAVLYFSSNNFTNLAWM